MSLYFKLSLKVAIKRGFVCFLLQHLLYAEYFIYNENESKELLKNFLRCAGLWSKIVKMNFNTENESKELPSLCSVSPTQ